MSKHTRGKWNIVPVQASEQSDRTVACVSSGGTEIARIEIEPRSIVQPSRDVARARAEERMDIARLIAAAPEMLEALENLVAAADARHVVGLSSEYRAINKAIAKAKSES